MKDVEIICHQCGKIVAVLRVDGPCSLFARTKYIKGMRNNDDNWRAMVLCSACAEKEEA